MLAAIDAWLSAAALPFLIGFVAELWKEWQADKATVDAGAAQQRATDQTAEQAAVQRAGAIANATSVMSDADVAAALAERLHNAAG